MHPATGHAAWQIEQANAPKQASGSITAIVLGAFFRGPPIILVHMGRDYISGGCRAPWERRAKLVSGADDRPPAHRFRAFRDRAMTCLRRSRRSRWSRSVADSA